MKRLSADDSADSRVKVGHRQATYADTKPLRCRGFGFSGRMRRTHAMSETCLVKLCLEGDRSDLVVRDGCKKDCAGLDKTGKNE